MLQRAYQLLDSEIQKKWPVRLSMMDSQLIEIISMNLFCFKGSTIINIYRNHEWGDNLLPFYTKSLSLPQKSWLWKLLIISCTQHASNLLDLASSRLLLPLVYILCRIMAAKSIWSQSIIFFRETWFCSKSGHRRLSHPKHLEKEQKQHPFHLWFGDTKSIRDLSCFCSFCRLFSSSWSNCMGKQLREDINFCAQPSNICLYFPDGVLHRDDCIWQRNQISCFISLVKETKILHLLCLDRCFSFLDSLSFLRETLTMKECNCMKETPF